MWAFTVQTVPSMLVHGWSCLRKALGSSTVLLWTCQHKLSLLPALSETQQLKTNMPCPQGGTYSTFSVLIPSLVLQGSSPVNLWWSWSRSLLFRERGKSCSPHTVGQSWELETVIGSVERRSPWLFLKTSESFKIPKNFGYFGVNRILIQCGHRRHNNR